MGFSAGVVEKWVWWRYHGAVSRVRRLLVADRIFFVTVNLRRRIPFLKEEEFPLVVEVLADGK